LRAVANRHRPDVGMQIDHGCRYKTGLLRQDHIAGGLIRRREAGAASSKTGVANGSSLESRWREICGFDQRGGCADECAAEEHLPRLLSGRSQGSLRYPGLARVRSCPIRVQGPRTAHISSQSGSFLCKTEEMTEWDRRRCPLGLRAAGQCGWSSKHERICSLNESP
jgi:hypothetical protein